MTSSRKDPVPCCYWCHAAVKEGFKVRCQIDFALHEPGEERCVMGRDPLEKDKEP